MTARDFNGTTDRLDWANVLDATSGAFTLSFWADIDALANLKNVFAFNNSADTGAALNIFLRTDSGNYFQVFFGVSSGLFFHSFSGLTTGRKHYLVTWNGTIAAGAINAYANGSAMTSLAESTTGSGITAATGVWSLFGRSFDDTRNVNGRIQWPAWWNRVLSADEIAALAAGYHPSFFENGLVWCPDLSSLKDPYSGLTGTADGTTTQDSVGPQIMPCGPMVWTAAPSFVGSPWYYNLQQQLLAG